MKAYIVTIKPRGSEYAFSRTTAIKVYADSAKEAREEAILQVGDCYKVVKTTVVK